MIKLGDDTIEQSGGEGQRRFCLNSNTKPIEDDHRVSETEIIEHHDRTGVALVAFRSYSVT